MKSLKERKQGIYLRLDPRLTAKEEFAERVLRMYNYRNEGDIKSTKHDCSKKPQTENEIGQSNQRKGVQAQEALQSVGKSV